MDRIETFEDAPESRWRFFTDGVMGGVSRGGVTYLEEVGGSFARLEGNVSTANNGGFIQIRRDLTERPDAHVSAVHLIVRGNGERYFVHLRTTATRAPWHYFQAGFATGADWAEVALPFADFGPSAQLIRPLLAGDITSIAIVAYGREHDALIDIGEVGFR